MRVLRPFLKCWGKGKSWVLLTEDFCYAHEFLRMILEDAIQSAVNNYTLAEGDELVKFKIEWREDGKDAQPQY
jgi:hypothetical protein